MLKEQIQADLKEAMKAGDTGKVSVLRMLSAAFSNMEIAKRGEGEMTDKDYETVVKKEVKKLEDAIEQYRAGGRPELAEKEEAELKIMAVYMPEMMGEAEVAAIVDAVVGEMGGEMSNPPSPEQIRAGMGKIIGEVMKRSEGKADGGMISKLVKEKLG